MSYPLLYKLIPDKIVLKHKFKNTLGYKLNLKNPKTYNEKLQWLKLYDRNPLYTTMVDKYEVKPYVASIIGDEYIVPTLGVWEKFEDIDFESLPEKFVLKCTHDSGGVVICKDKSHFDKEAAREKLNESLKCNFYWFAREWPYKNVKPRIIAEKYLDASTDDLTDYKFMCFNGNVKTIFTCTNRFSKDGLNVTFFDREWNRLPFERRYRSDPSKIDPPHNLRLMIDLAERLSVNIPMVRVDFYEINGNVYFGELTFFPGGGFEEFIPEEWDKIVGGWLQLPRRITING